ncbi:MAG: hydrogenase iron-sulfur subunit [Acidobacteria bacterium]|nr:MAG: hydrogenase iron-sulfur subunit [Acidobacteriota bacterium]
MAEGSGEGRFEPRIVGFLCNWCSYRAADLAGTSRRRYAPNVRCVRVMCSGRVEPGFVLKAFALGADGVLIAGCHPGECHYIEQNYKTLRRVAMLHHVLKRFGIERERLRLVWASAAEGARLAAAADEMTEALRRLGPLRWPERRSERPEALEAVARTAAEHREALEVSR